MPRAEPDNFAGTRAAVALVTATRALDGDLGSEKDTGTIDELLRGYVQELKPNQLRALIVSLIVIGAQRLDDQQLSELGHSVA